MLVLNKLERLLTVCKVKNIDDIDLSKENKYVVTQEFSVQNISLSSTSNTVTLDAYPQASKIEASFDESSRQINVTWSVPGTASSNYVKDNFITEKVKFLIKGNLIANLIFPFHSSKINSINNLINIKSIDFDLNYSILYYLIICIVVIVFGGYVVEKYEFIINNKEME